MTTEKPWHRFYASVPPSIDYPECTMYEALTRSVNKVPDKIAWECLNTECSYKEFDDQISRCSNALAHLGLKKGDRITIAMPTMPQGIICFYAANKLGAVASMIHPLSTAKEIEYYLSLSESKMALTLNEFQDKFDSIIADTPCETLILTQPDDYLKQDNESTGGSTASKAVIEPGDSHKTARWQDLLNTPYPEVETVRTAPDDTAVILYSGGTTGTPKGIMLSNMNFIAQGMMQAAWMRVDEDDAFLAMLPIFHGFGLGICINAAFMGGCRSILVPQFSPEIVASLIKTKMPNFIFGVPTLYAALNENEDFQSSDLSCLKAAFCGADSLPSTVRDEFGRIVKARGGKIKLLEGYGLTEAVTGIMATPIDMYREGSVGVPFPDMDAKIVFRDSIEDAPIGEEGELCVAGPAVMKGYLNNPKETDNVLKTHKDGKIWLHTGDIASQDEDGFFYFKLRMKRMIKSSGMNVYPAQVEEVLYRHPDVDQACVIGVPDEKQIERVKAFVVLKQGVKDDEAKATELIMHCQAELIKWSCPRSIEFRKSLPLTRVGKVAFTKLKDEEIEKLRQQGEYTGESLT